MFQGLRVTNEDIGFNDLCRRTHEWEFLVDRIPEKLDFTVFYYGWFSLKWLEICLVTFLLNSYDYIAWSSFLLFRIPCPNLLPIVLPVKRWKVFFFFFLVKSLNFPRMTEVEPQVCVKETPLRSIVTISILLKIPFFTAKG